jgi:hypothetical protein
MKPTLTVTKDFTKELNETIARFKKDAVLIGIPQSESQREGDEEINNAAILALNHFGSENAHIPPRPVLTIGIKNAQEAIAEQFKLLAKNILKKGQSALTVYYERAGIIAANACKAVINDGSEILPPSPATIKARKYLTKSGFKGTKSLLVTGQMRNAITYVVQSLWRR